MARKRRKVTKKISGRRTPRVKPMKIAALIVSAIQNLRETKGLAPSKIIGYISYASNMGEGRVKRQVKTALKKGVEYGILKRYKGHYFLPTSDELDHANRIAMRFARLQVPCERSLKSNTASRRKIVPLSSRKKTKRLVKSRTPVLTPTISSVDCLCESNLRMVH